jgi:hypothetical protein
MIQAKKILFVLDKFIGLSNKKILRIHTLIFN